MAVFGVVFGLVGGSLSLRKTTPLDALPPPRLGYTLAPLWLETR